MSELAITAVPAVMTAVGATEGAIGASTALETSALALQSTEIVPLLPPVEQAASLSLANNLEQKLLTGPVGTTHVIEMLANGSFQQATEQQSSMFAETTDEIPEGEYTIEDNTSAQPETTQPEPINIVVPAQETNYQQGLNEVHTKVDQLIQQGKMTEADRQKAVETYTNGFENGIKKQSNPTEETKVTQLSSIQGEIQRLQTIMEEQSNRTETEQAKNLSEVITSILALLLLLSKTIAEFKENPENINPLSTNESATKPQTETQPTIQNLNGEAQKMLESQPELLNATPLPEKILALPAPDESLQLEMPVTPVPLEIPISVPTPIPTVV